jgi:hypothetical protein
MSDSEFTTFLKEIREDIRTIKEDVERLKQQVSQPIIRRRWFDYIIGR